MLNLLACAWGQSVSGSLDAPDCVPREPVPGLPEDGGLCARALRGSWQTSRLRLRGGVWPDSPLAVTPAHCDLSERSCM